VQQRLPSPVFAKKAIEAGGGALRERLSRVLPSGLFERAARSLRTVERSGDALRRAPGRCGSLLAEAIQDAAAGMGWTLAEAVEGGELAEVSRGLRVLRALEALAAGAGRDVLRSRRGGVRMELSDSGVRAVVPLHLDEASRADVLRWVRRGGVLRDCAEACAEGLGYDLGRRFTDYRLFRGWLSEGPTPRTGR